MTSPPRSRRTSATLDKNKRTTSQHKSKLRGCNPDTPAGWKVLRGDASALKTVRDVDAMQKEIESLPGSSTPGRKSLLAVLAKQRESLTKQQAEAARRRREAQSPEEAELEKGRRLALDKKKAARQREAEVKRQLDEATKQQLDEATKQRLEEVARQLQEKVTELQSTEAKWEQEIGWVREGQKVPSWDELPGYAATIPRRRIGEQPHSMFIHLLQRLSDARNGDGPPVKVRAAQPDGTIRYETVTKDNYQAVVQAAGAFRWEGFDARNLSAIQKLTTEWKPLPVSPDDIDNMVSDWRKKLQATGFPEVGGKRGPDLATAYQTQIATACQKILEWVEPGVRDLVGLPDIVVHGPEDPRFKPEDEGEYDAKNKVIHLSLAKLISENGAELLLHEFGHHIEDQGPVETWGSFASYLGRLSRGANLMPPREYKGKQLSDNPLYCSPDDDSIPKLPRAHDGYSLQYYPTALTESIPLAMEYSVPDDPGGATNTDGDKYDSEYIGLVLPAIRPEAARKAGMDLWTWL